MDSPIATTFTSSADTCTLPTLADDPWADFLQATSLESRPSEPSPAHNDDDWSEFAPMDDPWAEFMVPMPTENCPSKSSIWDINQDCATYSVSDWSDFTHPSPVGDGSIADSVTMEDVFFQSFSEAAFSVPHDARNVDAQQVQSPTNRLAGPPPTPSFDLSQHVCCSSEISRDDFNVPFFNLNCKTQSQQLGVKQMAVKENSEASGQEFEASAQTPRTVSHLSACESGGKKRNRGRKVSKSNSKKRRSNALDDDEYFPSRSTKQHRVSKRLQVLGSSSGHPCLRIVRIDIQFSHESWHYSFNRLQKRWVCKTDSPSKLVEPENMRQIADNWGRSLMEVSVDVGDQRLHFEWDASMQVWEAKDFLGEPIYLGHDVLSKLIQEPANSILLI